MPLVHPVDFEAHNQPCLSSCLFSWPSLSSYISIDIEAMVEPFESQSQVFYVHIVFI